MTVVRRNLPHSGIRAVFDRVAEIESSGRAVLNLGIGFPRWDETPPGIIDDVIDAVQKDDFNYIANRGLLELRAAISDDTVKRIGRRFDPETELVVTHGLVEGLAVCSLAFLGAGDEVIVHYPAWDHYTAVAELAGATPVPLNLKHADDFLIDPDHLASLITPRTKMLLLNSPNNPTGAVQPAETLKAIAGLSEKHGFLVLADDIYHEFVYHQEHVSIASFMKDSPLLLYANGFSKSYSMAGWRIGYVASAAPNSDALNRIHQYVVGCGTTFAHTGAAGLLRHPQRQGYIDRMRQVFAGRQTLWTSALAECDGVQLVRNSGAIYLFPRIEFQGMTGREFCYFMLEEHQVAMIPGDEFGAEYGRHVRISFGSDGATQQRAANIISEVLS